MFDLVQYDWYELNIILAWAKLSFFGPKWNDEFICEKYEEKDLHV